MTNKAKPHIGTNFYCPRCDLKFGAVPDAQGKVLCLICKQPINQELAGVLRIDHVTYRCQQCGLRFGAVPKEGEQIFCPLCSKIPHKEGG